MKEIHLNAAGVATGDSAAFAAVERRDQRLRLPSAAAYAGTQETWTLNWCCRIPRSNDKGSNNSSDHSSSSNSYVYGGQLFKNRNNRIFFAACFLGVREPAIL